MRHWGHFFQGFGELVAGLVKSLRFWISAFAAVLLLLNRALLERLAKGALGVSPWWAALPLGLVLFDALLRANYRRQKLVGDELADLKEKPAVRLRRIREALRLSRAEGLPLENLPNGLVVKFVLRWLGETRKRIETVWSAASAQEFGVGVMEKHGKLLQSKNPDDHRLFIRHVSFALEQILEKLCEENMDSLLLDGSVS